MMFVGNGSLLIRAINFTRSRNYPIDLVVSESSEIENYCEKNKLFFSGGKVNGKKEIIKEKVRDKIVFSINNYMIIKKELLLIKGFKFYNIHNGIIPRYRGRPEVCIIFAILNGEREYGVSLHEINEGIDTGPCIDILKYPIKMNDSFQDVMMKGIEHCHTIFCTNLDSIMQKKYRLIEVPNHESKLYSNEDLKDLKKYKDSNKFKRATNIGDFKFWYHDLYIKVNEQ